MEAETAELLFKKIMILNEHVWEQRAPKPKVEKWLQNFSGRFSSPEVEQAHALFWLSQFMYFGARELRVLIRALYRDLYLRPVIREVRGRLGKGASDSDLALAVADAIDKTKFFGVGNPSESGTHLLYYFRQENSLQKHHFMDAVQIFSRGADGSRRIKKPEVERYVFLDDICGSGDTAVDYSEQVLTDLKALSPGVIVSYYCLFATKDGMRRVRDESLFGSQCGAVYELDETYKCLSEKSRYFGGDLHPGIDRKIACDLVKLYGDLLDPAYATGWKDSQMLMGFHHNTPDNTLGMVWFDSDWGGSLPWAPMFKRYPKV